MRFDEDPGHGFGTAGQNADFVVHKLDVLDVLLIAPRSFLSARSSAFTGPLPSPTDQSGSSAPLTKTFTMASDT